LTRVAVSIFNSHTFHFYKKKNADHRHANNNNIKLLNTESID